MKHNSPPTIIRGSVLKLLANVKIDLLPDVCHRKYLLISFLIIKKTSIIIRENWRLFGIIFYYPGAHIAILRGYNPEVIGSSSIPATSTAINRPIRAVFALLEGCIWRRIAQNLLVAVYVVCWDTT